MNIRTITVTRRKSGQELVPFLADSLQLSRKRAKALLDERAVTINGKRIWMARHRVSAGDVIGVALPDRKEERSAHIRIFQDDGNLMVADKLPGLPTQGKDSVESRLRRQCNCPELRAVHRLDRDTSGCLVLARTDEIAHAVFALFKQRKVTKHYRAIVHGRLPHAVQRLDEPIDGQDAVSHVRVIGKGDRVSYVNVRIITGRTHQIRKHLAGIRHPVVADRQYFSSQSRQERFRTIPRQMLHAYSLSMPHPLTGTRIEVTSPLPRDFHHALQQLGLESRRR